jgi:hypothetical protein
MNPYGAIYSKIWIYRPLIGTFIEGEATALLGGVFANLVI